MESMMNMSWAEFGSRMASLVIICTTIKQFFPYCLQNLIEKLGDKIMKFCNPYVKVTFHEYVHGRWKRSEAYVAIETYLASLSTEKAKRLNGEIVKKSKHLAFSIDEKEKVADVFNGVKVVWTSKQDSLRTQNICIYPSRDEKKRYFQLSFHKRHRGLILGKYVKHVMDEGKAIGIRNRQQRLFTNNPSDNWSDYKSNLWSHVPFEHPARFETLAMEPKEKEEIMNDLLTFSKRKEYYEKIGKAWKRGYLLYGPPGTGKSSMISAIANLLHYDVYDLELTSVMDNSELRKLLIGTTSKSIIVIEDIDCSLDLTGKRKMKRDCDSVEEVDPIGNKAKGEDGSKASKVTLSGLLNFIDGLWSAIGGERIIIFTTNHLEKLDPALIRRGRMDKHIEMSYCKFGAFKVLAKNYLDIETHDLFGRIEKLLEETNISPADVSEILTLKDFTADADSCLQSLIKALEATKKSAATEDRKTTPRAKKETMAGRRSSIKKEN